MLGCVCVFEGVSQSAIELSRESHITFDRSTRSTKHQPRLSCWRFCISVSRNWHCHTTNRIPCGGCCRRLLFVPSTCRTSGPSDANEMSNLFKFALWKMHTPFHSIFLAEQRASHAMQIHWRIWFLFILLFIAPFSPRKYVVFLHTIQRCAENWVADSFRIYNCFCLVISDWWMFAGFVSVCVPWVSVDHLRQASNFFRQDDSDCNAIAHRKSVNRAYFERLRRRKLSFDVNSEFSAFSYILRQHWKVSKRVSIWWFSKKSFSLHQLLMSDEYFIFYSRSNLWWAVSFESIPNFGIPICMAGVSFEVLARASEGQLRSPSKHCSRNYI